MIASDELLRSEHDARLFRLILRAGRDGALVQDVIDCADLARAAEHGDLAARLTGLALLQLGGGAAMPAALASGGGRSLLNDGRSGFSVDLAIGELRELIAFHPRLAERDLVFPATDPGPHPRPAPAAAEVARVTRASDALLVAVPAFLADGGFAEALRMVADDILSLPPIALDEHLNADLDRLVSLLGLRQIRRFLIANLDLLRAANDGPPIFEAAARLGPTALGSHFSNVRMLIRNARDLFALIEAAGDRPARAVIETWCVLLSAHLRQDQLVDLADELGDRGMTVALKHLLTRAARADGPPYPLDPVWRVRDVCLDIGEWGVAADAQQLIALWRPRDPNEWRILAEIRAHMDDAIGVEGALDRAMLMCPDDPATRKRIAAWQAGTMPPILGGYGTPPGRRRLRQARVAAYRALA